MNEYRVYIKDHTDYEYVFADSWTEACKKATEKYRSWTDIEKVVF